MNEAQHLRDLIDQKEIEAVVFDFDGTLYSSSAKIELQLKPAMVRTASKYTNLPEDDARNLLREYRAEFKSSILGLVRDYDVNPHEFYREVYDNLDLTNMKPYDGLAEALENLSEICPIYVLTNSNSTFTHRSLEKLGIDKEIFEHVYTVEDNNFIRKPNREVYEDLFANKLQVTAEKVAFFDDIASSLKMVGSMGSKTILVGNGLREAPYFVDLHTAEEHNGKPDFVSMATHNISKFVQGMCHKL